MEFEESPGVENSDLTLTSVVFEYFLMERLEGFRQDLTLTSVVFEL